MEPVGIKKGYREDGETRQIYPDHRGTLMVEMKELERIELHLGQGKQLAGWMVVGDRLKSLPVGSTFDPGNGTFFWQAGPAFCGDYQLLFMGRDAYGNLTKYTVFVRIAPKF
jgi:hypothetical protein